ncbi:flagellar protein FlgN [Camelliibacillus cellulosilyticus]|uniref:Flagellar protein FlgN n=1 Tax=Camelliibacillus cellulosilyticus TaxID=2174486 RepID=A0ABV9GMN4_9BACL
MIQAIADKIEEMIDVHHLLYQLATDKTEAIKNGDFQTMDQIINKESVEVERLSQLEQEREHLTNAFMGDIEGGQTFSALITRAPDAEQKKLSNLQSELAEVVFLLKKQNDLNQDLLRQSLDWVELNINLLNPTPKPVNYGHPRGEKPVQPALSRFDTKA